MKRKSLIVIAVIFALAGFIVAANWGLMRKDLRPLIMLVTVMSASACGVGSRTPNTTTNTANENPANIAVSNKVTEAKTAGNSARDRNINRAGSATAHGRILCGPGDPHFTSQRTTESGIRYYECYNDKRDARVAAYLTRIEGFRYMILGVKWRVEDGAAPLQVVASSVSVKYADADGHTAQLAPVYRLNPDYDSLAENVYAQQNGLKATTINPGHGYSGIVYFEWPDQTDSVKDKADSHYVAEVRVRDEVIAFRFPVGDLQGKN